MSKSRIASILAASMEDVRAADAAEAAEAAAAAAAADQTADAGAAAADATAAAADQTAPIVDAAPVEPVTNPDTLEADIADANEAEAEVQTNSDAVAELDEVAEGLEAIALSLESAIAEGGLTPQAAQFANMAFESYATRLGEEVSTLSLESFGGSTSRVKATTVTLESVREVLNKVWEAIKNIVMKVRDAIIGFFKSMFDGVTKLKERAEKVKAQAEGISGEAKGKVSLGGLAQKLAVGNAVSLKNDSVDKIIPIVEGAIAFDQSATGLADKQLAALRQAAQSGTRVAVDTNLKAPAAFSEHKDGRFSTPNLQGNVAFYIEPYKSGDGFGAKAGDAIEKLFGNGYTVGKEQNKSEVGSSVEIDALSKDEIVHVAEGCIKLAEVIASGKDKVAVDKGLVSGLKQIKFSKELSGDQVAGVKADMKAFQRVAAAQDQCSAKIFAWAINTGRAHLAVAEKSVAAYKGGAKAEEKAEDKAEDKKAA